MDVCVGLVLELAGQKPTMLARQLDGLAQHAHALLGGRREHHLGAHEPHDLAALDAEVLGHHDHQRIATARTYHRQANPRVAAGRLDHGLTGLEHAAFLGRVDDPERQSVLDRAHRVPRLYLHVQLDVLRPHPSHAYDRRASYGRDDVLVPSHDRGATIAEG